MVNFKEPIRKYYRALPWITLKEFLMIIVSTVPYALTVNQLLVPHAIVCGGVTGLCEIIYFATNTYVPIWLSSALINAAFTIGRRYALRTIWGVLWLTIWLKVIPIAEIPLLTDSFMAVVVGGLFTGCFLGICFLNNGSTGGTDIIAMIVNKYHHLPMGRVLLFADDPSGRYAGRYREDPLRFDLYVHALDSGGLDHEPHASVGTVHDLYAETR